MSVNVPPIKSQGIKSKLSEWIKSVVDYDYDYDRWVEPFMGTGVVAFNVQPKKALMCDSNPHIINFYKDVQSEVITGDVVRGFLEREGELLLDSNGSHYYDVRKRFNNENSPLDFLFLSRSCFNGMMRFNKKGGYNVPFCKKPHRFAKPLVTKIVNQVDNISNIIKNGDYEFRNIDFRKTLELSKPSDLIYCDPPYLGRNVDYFDSWSAKDEIELRDGVSSHDFILSTWLENKYRFNEGVESFWGEFNIKTKDHFYHVGGSESNRSSVVEALISNIEMNNSIKIEELMKEKKK